MDYQLLQACLVTTVLAIITYIIMLHRKKLSVVSSPGKTDPSTLQGSSPEFIRLIGTLSEALPNNIFLPCDAAIFTQSTSSCWAKQGCEVTPTCVVRPYNVQQLSEAVAILKQEYDAQVDKGEVRGLFAVRGGGHSVVPGAASIRRGILIDLGRLNKVTPSEDGASVTIEAGARWIDISDVLDGKGLAVVSGRNSHVGVGGPDLRRPVLFCQSRSVQFFHSLACVPHLCHC